MFVSVIFNKNSVKNKEALNFSRLIYIKNELLRLLSLNICEQAEENIKNTFHTKCNIIIYIT